MEEGPDLVDDPLDQIGRARSGWRWSVFRKSSARSRVSMLVTRRASCRPLAVICRRISCSWSDRSGLDEPQELGQSQDQRDRRVELVAGHLDERRLELAGAGQLVVGLDQLGVGRLQLGDQPSTLGQQLVLLDPLADDPLELGAVPRLEDVAEDVPLVDGTDDRLDVGVAGEEHPDRVGLQLAGPGGARRRPTCRASAGR